MGIRRSKIEFNPVILAERYREEGSERALAKVYGVSRGTIHRHLVKHGIPRKPYGSWNFKRGRDGWARDYDECIECGTDERPHKARGLCDLCYGRERNLRTTDRRWGVLTTKPHRKKEEELVSPLREVIIISQKRLVYACAKCGYEHYVEVSLT